MKQIDVIPYNRIQPKIYAYTFPKKEAPLHDGYIKVGETTRDIEKRITEQTGPGGFNPRLLFKRKARKIDGTWFSDHDLHNYFELNNIERGDFNDSAREWFYFNDTPELAEQLTDKYINLDYDEIQISKAKSDYILREEQNNAVEKTLSYYKSNKEPKEFLWNAKPRFGKTLTTYDFIRKINAQNILIVTNRPAIANSWYDDFIKFISWQEKDMKFVSNTDALNNKAMDRDVFVDLVINNQEKDYSQISFISLQDLKGAQFAGGPYNKLEWVSQLNWDLLVIDEAHEGVDTEKTDRAFEKIKRDFTLHLSGTPFKAIANNKFNTNQIYNWSYVDEQDTKIQYQNNPDTNPYEELPTLNLFTYQMSNLIIDEIEQGRDFGEDNYDYVFDLNEFFSTNKNGDFIYENDVRHFLDNLASGRFPFAKTEYRQELDHTFWLLSRVASVKALKRLLNKHPVFKDYKIILAVGNEKDQLTVDEQLEEQAYDMKRNESSYSRVKRAIDKYDRTITLSVGQLTTGVTIPEWTGVFMLSNIQSPVLYFQAAFRAQNPNSETNQEGELYRKENAYIFDFAPERTLTLFDELANNLSNQSASTTSDRKKNIRELLNFFPVIAEDSDGQMREIDATKVLTIPKQIKATEVVNRGFMSNLLFNNIAGIFSAPAAVQDILNKIPPEENKRHGDRKNINVTNPLLNEENEVDVPDNLVINETDSIFGDSLYKDQVPKEDYQSDKIVNDILNNAKDGFENIRDEYNLTKKAQRKIHDDFKEEITNKVTQYVSDLKHEQDKAQEKYDSIDIPSESDKDQLNKKKQEAVKSFNEQLTNDVRQQTKNVIENEIVNVEEDKKKTTEDDVRDHLRGFSRTIPAFLMAYGNKKTTLQNFEQNIDENTFLKLTSITIDEFKKLRDGFDYTDENGSQKHFKGLFNEVVFNASIDEFFDKKSELDNYFDDGIEEDIFDYIPPQKTNQIFTPKDAVKKMVDTLEKRNPRIFTNKHYKFIDLYTKSGLFLTEIIKRLFEKLKNEIPDDKKRIKWIIENQIYGVAPTNIIYNIVKNYVLGNIEYTTTHNIKEYDLTENAETRTLSEKLTELYRGDDLKFDVVIGNPPYQEEDGGAQASARPIYNHFIEATKELNPEYMSYIIPTRWYVGGKGLNSFRENMLNDRHLVELHDFLTPQDIFPNTNIRGGVCYFLWDKDYNYEDETRVVSYENGKIINDVNRPMKIDGIDIFVRDGRAPKIINKIRDDEFESLKSYVSPLRPFGFRGYFVDDERFNTSPENLKDPVICYGRRMEKGFIEREIISKRSQWIDKWKIITPRANNIGTELNDDNLNTHIGKPNTICTESYIVIGADLNLNEQSTNNLSKYLSTKFTRYLHSLAKGSQDATSKTYNFIPVQDFTKDSDVDWDASIKGINDQLFEKYNLTQEEINHIDNKIKEM